MHHLSTVSTFCMAFNISIVGEHTDFKFGVQVDHSKFQPTDNKLSLRGGAVTSRGTIINF